MKLFFVACDAIAFQSREEMLHDTNDKNGIIDCPPSISIKYILMLELIRINWMVCKYFQEMSGYKACFCREDGCNGSEMLASVPLKMLAVIYLTFYYMI